MPQDPWAALDAKPASDPWSALDNTEPETTPPTDEESIRRTVARLKAIKPANEAQRQRIEKLIDQYETHGHNVASNLARGFGAGVVRAIPKIASTLNTLTGQADPEAERIQKIDEFFDAGGKAGTIGGFAGELLGSGPVYGKAVGATAEGMAKISPTVGKWLASVAKPGASLLRHAAVNVATGLPINIAQALGTPDIPIPADATPEEAQAIKRKNHENTLFNIGVGVAADAIFGSATEGARRGLGKVIKPKITGEAVEPPVNPDREAELEAARAKRIEKEQKLAFPKKMRRLAKAEWELANPDKTWNKNLTPEERKALTQDYIRRTTGGDSGGVSSEQPSSGEPVGKEGEAPIVKSSVDLLWDKLQAGDLTITKQSGIPSTLLTEAKTKGINTREEFEKFYEQWQKDNTVSPKVQAVVDAAKAARERAAKDAERMAAMEANHAEAVEVKTAAELRRSMEAAGADFGDTRTPEQRAESEVNRTIYGDEASPEQTVTVSRQHLDWLPGGKNAKHAGGNIELTINHATHKGPFELDDPTQVSIPSNNFILHAGKTVGENSRIVQDALIATDVPIIQKWFKNGELDGKSAADVLGVVAQHLGGGEKGVKAAYKKLESLGLKGIVSRVSTEREAWDHLTLFNPEDVRPIAHSNLNERIDVDTPPMSDEQIQAHADAGFNEAMENRPPVELTPEQLAKKQEYDDIMELEAALERVTEKGGLKTEEQWNSFIEDVKLARERHGDNKEAFREELEDIIDDAIPPKEEADPADVAKQDEEIAKLEEGADKLTDLNLNKLSDIRKMDDRMPRSKDQAIALWAEKNPDLIDQLTPDEIDAIDRMQARKDKTQAEIMTRRPGDPLADTTEGIYPTEGNLPNNPTETPALPTQDSALPQTPQSTFLESLPAKVPIEEMTTTQLDAAEDKVVTILSDESKSEAVRQAAERDLQAIADHRRSQPQAPYEPSNPLPPEPAPVDPAITGAARVERVVEPIPEPGLDEVARQELRKKMARSLRKLSNDEIETGIKDLEAEAHEIDIEIQDTMDKAESLRAGLEGASEQDAKAITKKVRGLELSTTEMKERQAEVRRTLDRVLAERADRFLDNGLRAQIPPAIGGGAAGFIGGLFAPHEDEQDRMNNAWIGLAAGIAGGTAYSIYQRRVRGAQEKPRTAAELPGGEWQAEMQKHVVTGYKSPERVRPFLEKMRHVYFSTVRRSYVGERFTESLNANNLATARNPGKLMSMFGRWSAQTEAALRDGPSITDDFGNTKHLVDSEGNPVPGIHEILTDVEGDVETLGELAAARAKVELGDAVKTPFDVITAEGMFRSAPEIFHQAAAKLRKLNLGMADVAVHGGLLSQASRDKFANETMYATMMRIFKFDSYASTISTEKYQNDIVKAANPIKSRKEGSTASIKNPVESAAEMIPRIYRAAELNRIKLAFLDAWEAADKPDVGIRRTSKGAAGVDTAAHDALVQALKKEMELPEADAHALVASLDPEAINIKRGTMRVFRDGVVQTYDIPPDLAQAMLSLTPDEMGLVTKALGLPARVGAAGVVYNPFFIAKMGFFDMFQATANSAYGFRFGVDNIRGWYNIVTRSPKYQKLLAAGLSHQALAGGNLANIKTTAEALRQQAGSPLEVAIRHLKEARPIEFYKALIAPVADAARVGEALRALDHGASDIDAVFAAKNVTGNYSEIGAWHGMRALQHMTMFLGPALQVLDTAAYRAGVHPFRVSQEGRIKDAGRYAMKMAVMIGLPSWYLWNKAESEGDEEIRQMRTTELGRRNWFYRLNWDVPGFGKAGEIIKIPKPILDGQIFGTTVEMALDQHKNENPSNSMELLQGIGKDAAFNLLPSIGVIPASLQFNQNLSTGWGIEPQGSQDLPTEHRGEDNASWLSRNISRSVAPRFEGVNYTMLQRALSPAGLDYLFGSVGGMLGRDAVAAVSAALEYQDTGYVPAKQELPIIRQVFATSPSRQTHDIQEFYAQAGKIEDVGKTIAHLSKEDPTRLLAYMERHPEFALVGTYAKTRTAIAGFRRAIADLREMHTDIVSSEDRRKMIGEYVKMMNQLAASANQVSKIVNP